MKILIKNIVIENFKGIKKREIEFAKKTMINGRNASGKTTIFDALTWLLFNKDSKGDEKFNIRPLDASGNKIDNIEIKVIATFDIGGNEVVISKTQKQNWVTKRGTQNKELQGNPNSYEINTYPKTESEYKKFISEIMDEELFKMVINPFYFTSLKWQEQRSILMKFVTEKTDLEIAAENEKYIPLMNDLKNAPGTDDIKKKYQKLLTEFKKKQVELPTRIDESTRMKEDIDFAELEIKKKAIEEKLEVLNNDNNNDSKIRKDELETEKFELQFEINNMKRELSTSLNNQKRDLETEIDNIEHSSFGISSRKDKLVIENLHNEEEIKKYEKEKEALGVQYYSKKDEEFKGKLDFDETRWIFDESITVCNMCQQNLPSDKIEQLKEDFETRKANEKAKAEKDFEDEKVRFEKSKSMQLIDIIDKGNKLKNLIKSCNDKIQSNLKTINEFQNDLNRFANEKEKLLEQLSKLPKEFDYSSSEKYVELMKKDEELSKSIALIEENKIDTTKIEEEKAALEIELRNTKKELAKANINNEIDKRVSQLEEELSEISQKVADQEKMLYLLEEFIREKMNLISASINKQFNMVNFNLFEIQLNGGLKETCECTVNGVPFNSLNSGHKIIAGLDIINGLSRLYDLNCFVFVDNAESINEFNIPNVESQIILLSVTEDEILQIGV